MVVGMRLRSTCSESETGNDRDREEQEEIKYTGSEMREGSIRQRKENDWQVVLRLNETYRNRHTHIHTQNTHADKK